MADGRGPNVFTIPVHRAFADALVDGLLLEAGGDRLALARGLILLPTNRAVQAVREAFVRRAAPGLLLPRMAAIGDAELEEGIATALDPIAADPVPPAIEPLRRQTMLAAAIQNATAITAMEAMRLARELGRTRDQLLIERIEPAELRKVDTAGLSSHWQSALRQLTVLLDDWSEMLAATGCIDLADRRNRLLERLAARWRKSPPSGFVIAAGIASGAPAIGALLNTIARMPQGRVVLAGLDLAMDDAELTMVVGDESKRSLESHPQFPLLQMLDALGVARAEVRTWSGRDDNEAPVSRAVFVSNLFAPAAATPKWETMTEPARRAKGLAALALETPAEEAMAIALALRQAIEAPGVRAALITPDRALATRVSAQLGRWGITADDSGGVPLSGTLPGSLILAVAEVMAQEFAPVALMTLLKHPLVRVGEGRLAWLDHVRRLDLALRGPRPAGGVAGVTAQLADADSKTAEVAAWWGDTAPLLTPLDQPGGPLPALIETANAVATALAGETLWTGQDGRALAGLLENLIQHLAASPLKADATDLPALLKDTLDAETIRPAAGGHPRIHIWGLIEARLQRADVMILGGLNEGVWPQLPAPDPWLAPAIRRQLGLPGLERRIGIAAHDLAMALGAPNLLLTRARRDDRAPTIASRFWLRLQTMMRKLPPPETDFAHLARAIDQTPGPPQLATQPAPSPPAEDRPRILSITDLDRLSADPFAFYAKAMLGLSKLNPLDAEADAAWRGTIVHAIIEAWAKQDDYAPGVLVERMKAALDGPAVHPLTRTMGLPRLIEAAQWIEDEIAKGREEGRVPLVSEVKGRVKHGEITIHGRADRVDRNGDGTLAIVDYKTGEPPSTKQVGTGFAMQLGLTGLLAERGGFEGIAGQATEFEYWSLARGKDGTFGKVTSPCTGRSPHKIEADAFVDKAEQHLDKAVAAWLTGTAPFTAKLAPEHAWGDYDQLMRLEEWEGRGD